MRDDLHIDAFLEMMSAERGAAPNTLAAYGRDLSDASAFFGHQLASVTREDINSWIQNPATTTLASTTLLRRLSALRQFFRFLFETGIRADSPMADITGPKIARDVPDVLTESEVEALFQTCADDVRLTCLLELLYGAGLRASELVALPMGALPRFKHGRWETKALFVRGKGNKDRLCPLGPPALQALQAWLDVRETQFPKGTLAVQRAKAYVFPSRGKAGHLTRRRLGQLLTDLAHRTGLAPARVHPHALRHAYATHLLRGGVDLRTLQMLLGHADISTTEIYTHILTDELEAILLQAHPMASSQANNAT